ncbi:DMT family transporter [Sphingomonas piscis]|uniref:DMT family transporter n=2 Tax=Sphingomonas piscis TaxID=2714943 RepID=A0A6G7YTA1_9SPHN|nr:DMT family transporter [Sphingomonas piscis]
MGSREWGILLFLALIWGGSFFFIKVAVSHVPPLTFVWVRVTIAAFALIAYTSLRGEQGLVGWRLMGPMLIVALLNNVVPFLMFAWANTQIASGLTSILNATTPLWGVLLAHLYTDDERMTRNRLFGVIVGIGGVALMMGPAIFGQLGNGLVAQLACLVGAFSYAVAGVYARRFKKMAVSAMSVTSSQLAVSALLLLPVTLLFDRPWTETFPPLGAVAAILGLALVCTSFAYVLYFRLIETSGASNALLVPILVPPTAILLGGLFLGEDLHARDFGGLLLIALGLAAIDGRIFSLWRRPSLRPAA